MIKMNFLELKKKYYDILSKSQNHGGQGYIEHLFLTGVVSAGIAKQMGLSVKDQQSCFISGVFHDVAKIMPFIQNYFINEDNEDHFFKLRHHEISWLFYLSSRNFMEECLDSKYDIYCDLIENAIFYHHARTLYESDKRLVECSDDVINKLNKINQINNYKEILSGYLKELLLAIQNTLEINQPEIRVNLNINNSQVPPLFKVREIRDELTSLTRENSLRHIYRSCLINADRLVSSLSKEILLNHFNHSVNYFEKDLINYGVFLYNELKPKKEISFLGFDHIKKRILSQKCSHYKKLSLDQIDLAEKYSINNTNICNAPAGYGKTRIALLWIIKNLRKGEKILWVVPRNDIALSLGIDIPKDLDALIGPNKISIEVFLTGARVQEVGANISDEIIEFDADITITNIDNLLNPYTKHSIANRIVDIHKSIIVFDEWHEFYSDEPMFYVFIQLLYGRNIISRSKTLLLSATPISINHFWDDVENKTFITNKIKHWHQKKFIPKYTESIDEIPQLGGSCFVFNSVAETVKFAKNKSNMVDHIIHGYFIKNEKKGKLFSLINSFDREKCNQKERVSSCLIIQASLNISFKVLVDSILSPLKTIQVLGRGNRFAEYDECYVYFLNYKQKSKNEYASIRSIFNISLNEKWTDQLKILSEKEYFIYDEIYDVFNDFFEKNHDEFISWIENILLKSLIKTKNLPPLFDYKKNKVDYKILPSGSLRDSLGSYYVTAYWDNEDRFLWGDELFTYDKSDAEDVAKEMKSDEFRRSPAPRLFNDEYYKGKFSYPKKKNKKFSIDDHKEIDFVNMARSSMSPLITLKKFYHSKYGLCSKKWFL